MRLFVRRIRTSCTRAFKGYGETGPDREKKGLDLILQAEGGIMSVTGPEGGSPVKAGQAICDLTAGIYAALGIMTRLREVARGKGGGKLDVSLFDAIVSIMNEYLTSYSIDGRVPGPQGTTHQTIVPYQLFETKDGYIVTGVPTDDRWDEFVDTVGCESVRDYATNKARVEHEAAVVGAIQSQLDEETTTYWLESLIEAGFPAGPVNTVADVVEHDQAAARNLVIDHDDPDAGTIILPGHPIRFPNFSTEIHSPAPRLGADTEAVFEDVALDQTVLDEWRTGGAFGDG